MDAKGLFDQGEALYKQGNRDGAIAAYTEAIRLKPDFAEAYISRGVVRRAKGDPDGAIADYDEGIRLNPQSIRAFVSRGIAKRAKNDLDGAIRDYSEAMRINPKDSVALNNRGYTRYEKGDYMGAIADCSEAIRQNPKQSFYYYSRGMAYGAWNKTDLARQDFQQALTLNPNHPKAQYMSDKIGEWSGPASPSFNTAAIAQTAAPPATLAFTSTASRVPSPFDAPVIKADEGASLVFGIIGGSVGALIGAILWGAFTAITHFEVGLIAIAIGFLVGWGVRFAGRGNDLKFGAVGAVLALLGCFLGNIFAVYFLVAARNPALASRLVSRPDIVVQVMGDNLGILDVVFYGIAMYEGFRFSMKPIK